MSRRMKLWSLITIFFFVYVVNFFVVATINTTNLVIWFIGLLLFVTWFVWEGKRSGFLYILLKRD
jgi:hypothetical protein